MPPTKATSDESPPVFPSSIAMSLYPSLVKSSNAIMNSTCLPHALCKWPCIRFYTVSPHFYPIRVYIQILVEPSRDNALSCQVLNVVPFYFPRFRDYQVELNLKIVLSHIR